MKRERELGDLSGIGKSMLGDFEKLGIRSVKMLARSDGKKLYEKLCHWTGTRQDPCVFDRFCCGVDQARPVDLSGLRFFILRSGRACLFGSASTTFPKG